MNAKTRPQATSKRLVETDRAIVTELAAGQSYARNVGVEHNRTSRTQDWFSLIRFCKWGRKGLVAVRIYGQ